MRKLINSMSLVVNKYLPIELFRHIGLYLGLSDKLNFRLVVKNLHPCFPDISERRLTKEDLFYQANI